MGLLPPALARKGPIPASFLAFVVHELKADVVLAGEAELYSMISSSETPSSVSSPSSPSSSLRTRCIL